MAVLEALAKEQRQAGAIVLREALKGYVPLGVFNVRENVRSAMREPGEEFEDIGDALHHLTTRFTLPVQRFMEEGQILKDSLHGGQKMLSAFGVCC